MAFPISSLTTDVRTLADALNATSIGNTLSYTAMSEVVGSNIQRRRYLVPAALKLVARESGAIFANVRKIGYKRLPPAEVHQVGINARRRVRNTSKRASETIVTVVAKANDMTNDEMKQALREVTVLDLLRFLATDKIVRALPESNKPEPVAKTMAAVTAFLNGND